MKNIKTLIINIILFIILVITSSSLVTKCYFNETLVKVPNLIGLNKDDAEKVLRKAGLDANLISSRSLDVPINYVYYQSPSEGEFVKKNRGIKLYINDDNGEKVPLVVGKTLTEAMAILEEKGIGLKRVDYIYTESNENKVLAVYPKENSRLAYGFKVSLLVSTKDLINSNKMPNIVGLDVNEANMILAQIGLKINEISRVSNTTFPVNVIVSTSPKADMPIDKNTVINVVISEENKDIREKEEIKQKSIDDIIKKALSEQEGSE